MAHFTHWMKFNVGDYLSDTMHLSTYQHGIYVMLIMHYFKRGELPTDEAELRRIAKVPSTLLWRREAPAVLAMWKLENGVPRHSRIDAARADAQRISEKRKSAGKSGAEKRWGMANAMSENGNCYDGLACARATPEPETEVRGFPLPTPEERFPSKPPRKRGGSVVSIHHRKGTPE